MVLVRGKICYDITPSYEALEKLVKRQLLDDIVSFCDDSRDVYISVNLEGEMRMKLMGIK